MADVLNMPVALPRTHECACLGAAVLAGTALGLFPDKAALAGFTGNMAERFLPDPVNVRLYKKTPAGT
jgi:sugar (pentulose or hexulose) kinase